MTLKHALTILLYATHYLSIAVWVGVMLFNLIVNFPAIRDRARSADEFAGAMGAQARRAGPWLYALIVLTFGSGWLLQVLVPQQGGAALPDLVVAIKVASIGAMLIFHLYGTMRLWPQIYFALDEERGPLLLRYQLAMVASSTFGILAILVTYWSRVTLLS
ncbi:MAG: hypothetical protein A3I66_04155 [Burkholderiales bacterium RIFCSPLOWO2_02_FULL_57_36]|nr:MAG: hypothetical protein A3I66_04155 [Burkholderiales bacterium RIFCSPLOWO2_02_FULL_57_36]